MGVWNGFRVAKLNLQKQQNELKLVARLEEKVRIALCLCVIVIYCDIHFIGFGVCVVLYFLYLYSTYFTSAFLYIYIHAEHLMCVYVLVVSSNVYRTRDSEARIFIELMIVELCAAVSLTRINDG